MKSTTAIVFSGGCYGTYLEWCLTTLCGNDDIVEPFTAVGSSHGFRGNHLLNMEGWRQYLRSNFEHQFVRLHPKTQHNESINRNLDEISQGCRNVIYVCPDSHSQLLVLNNWFYKVWPNWIKHSFSNDIDPQKIYSNWPVAAQTPIDQVPDWIMREFLSYYLVPAWQSQVEWHAITQQLCQNCLLLTVSDLLYRFDSTLANIQKFCNLEYSRPIDDLLDSHRKNLQIQQYISHDRLCNQIIDCVIGQKSFRWQPLTLASEAWIQWQLRNQGLEIRCDGLDTFPTDSVQLIELLYPL